MSDEPALGPDELRIRGQSILRPATRSLMEFAASGDAHLAEPSVVALGKIGDAIALSLLSSLFEDDQVSREAVTAVNSVEDPQVIELLLEGSKKSSPKMIAVCAEALEPHCRKDPRVMDRLEELATHAFGPVRRATLVSLRAAPAERARPLLVKALGDSDPDVVVVALQSLAEVGVEEGLLDTLEEVFDQTQEPKIRATLVDLFGCFPQSLAINPLKKALRDPNPRVRANAVEALHGLDDLGDRRRLALLRPMIQEGENNRVMGNIAIALGEADPPTSVQVLSKLLNSTEKWERASAVYAARYVKNDRVASWLTVQLTSEDDEDVVRNILGSLEHFEGEEVIRCFLRALEHGNPQVRSGAARALGAYHEVDVETALIKLLDEEGDQGVLCEAIRSLGRMSDSSKIPLLAKQLQHTDLRVQATSIEALAAIGTVEIVPHIEPFLNSTDNRVKANAAVAMWNAGNLSVVADLKEMLGSPSLKQRSSAVYALGELGASLRRLDMVDRYFLLASALQQEAPEEEVQVVEAGARPTMTSRSLEMMSVSESADGADDMGPEFPFEVIQEFYQHLEARDATAAVGGLGEALGKAPEDPFLHFLQGDVARRKKDLGAACASFDKVREQVPEFLNAHLFLAQIHKDAKEIPQSLEAYFRAVLSELEILRNYAEAGLNLLEKKKTSEASLLLKDLIAKVPLDHQSHLRAGLDFLRYKVYEKALAQLCYAYATRPASGEHKVGLAYAFFKRKQYERARKLCEDVKGHNAGEPALLQKVESLLQVMDKAGV